MPTSYTTVLFDLDHTLLDTHESERQAYTHAMTEAGLANHARHFARYVEINSEMWRAVERGEQSPNDVKAQRFVRLFEEIGHDADAVATGAAFAEGFGAFGDLYPGARELLEQTSAQARLVLITNGISAIQRTRIERLELDQYFDAIAISGELGFAKPGPEIFDYVFKALDQPADEQTIIVGDSLTSDMRGGLDYGIATCWYNPTGKLRPDSGFEALTFETASLAEVGSILSS